MAYNESDDKLEIQNEIRYVEQQLTDLGDEVYRVSMRRKFLQHKLADLKYELQHSSE